MGRETTRRARLTTSNHMRRISRSPGAVVSLGTPTSVIGVPYGGEDTANYINGRGYGQGVEKEAHCWCGAVQDLTLRDGKFWCARHRPVSR